MFLDREAFETVVASTPLVSIDLIVENEHGEYLLGKRTNRPVKDYWFVPGGRIQKNESMDAAFNRLCRQELGSEAKRNDATFLGPYEHFYTNSVFGEKPSTHYVVLAYQVKILRDTLQLPNSQHSEYQWFFKESILTNENIHLHSKWYWQA